MFIVDKSVASKTRLALGTGAVPIEHKVAMRQSTARSPGPMGIPCSSAIHMVEQIKYMPVPSMLIVAPRFKVNFATCGDRPFFSIATSIFNGRLAAEEEAPSAVSIGGKQFLKYFTGFRRAPMANSVGQKRKMCIPKDASTAPNNATMAVPMSLRLKRAEPAKTKLHTPAGLKNIRNLITFVTTSLISSTSSKVLLLRPSARVVGIKSPTRMDIIITEIKRFCAASPTTFFGTNWSKMLRIVSRVEILATSGVITLRSAGLRG
mmetsp:Transcript_50010/g.108898  ORF Transcript_50010/g.108898 Transcript_50010/m.108898 type:complete len:263 (+) Transcript_50010:329-1117(+)